jgi:hypothetical protein
MGSLQISQGVALAQKPNDDSLRKEIELLKRELDLLKRENELLKKENELLKKGGVASKSEEDKDSVARVTVGKVEYVYLGSERSGGSLVVTVLATSKDGNQQGPNGMMTIVDPDGDKYTGMPVGGFSGLPNLREGVPVKLSWQFGGKNAFTGEAKSSPSTKITRFAGVFIQRTVGGMAETIDFRNVPAQVVKAKSK